MADHLLVSASRPAPLRQLETGLGERLGPAAESALVWIHPSRAVVPATVLQALAVREPSLDVAALAESLGLQAHGLSDAAFIAQLGFRERGELAPHPRQAEISARAHNQIADATHRRFDWHLHQIGAVKAWEEVLGGLDAVAAIDWGAFRVAQIDTGYTQHPALGWSGGASSIVDVANDRNVFHLEFNPDSMFFNPSATVTDAADPRTGLSAGHGTRTSSVLAGFDRSALAQAGPDGVQTFAGFFGVAPRVPFVPIRLSNAVLIDDAPLHDALGHVLGLPQVRVVTMSMAIWRRWSERQAAAAMNALYERGVIFVCAAGNYLKDVMNPARLARTIAVGGVTFEDRFWTDSSCGPEIDIAAGAHGVRRASPEGRFRPRFVFGMGDGTSMATAMVAGAAALWLHHRGAELDSIYAEPWQRVAAFRALLRETARKPATGEWRDEHGPGILNVHALLSTALPDPVRLEKEPEV